MSRLGSAAVPRLDGIKDTGRRKNVDAIGAFDRAWVGKEYLSAARYSAERDYPNFFPAYAVRRDLVEVDGPDADAVRLGEFGGIAAYLSGRSVLVGCPEGELRVELLLSAVDAAAGRGFDVRVAWEVLRGCAQ